MPTSIPASTTTEPAPAARRRSAGFWSDALGRIVKSRAAMSGGLIVGLFLALAIIAALGTGLGNVILASGIFLVPQFARVVRGSVLTLKEMEFVTAARALGEGNLPIVFRYLLPNSLAPMIVQTTLRMATVLLTASGLSFLGLGVQPPSPEWGAMLSNSRAYMITAPHVATVPGLAIMLVVLGFNLLGDGLRDSLDPRLRE